MIDPEIAANEDCDNVLEDMTAEDLIKSFDDETPIQSLFGAVDEAWVRNAAGAPDDSEEAYEKFVDPWLAKYDAAYRTRAARFTRRAIALSTLALLRRLEWAGEHGACLECRACPRCDRTAREGKRGADLNDRRLLTPEDLVHRDGCALKAEIDRFGRETST